MKNALWGNASRRFMSVSVATISLGVGAYLIARDSGPTPEQIAAGRELFLHEWTENDPLSGEGDGLGPVFNERSCVACHSQGGIGGGGGNENNVLTFEVDPDRDRTEVVSHVVHAYAISEDLQETRKTVRDLFPIIPGGVRVIGGCSVDLANHNPVRFQEVNSPALFGAGVLDEISSMSVMMHNARRMKEKVSDEFSGDYRHNASGRVRTHSRGQIGRFGWKGQFASLEDFVAAACAMEMGLTNPKNAQPIARQHNADPNAKLDMTQKQLDALVAFVRSLPAPTQVLPVDESARRRVTDGQVLFGKIRCTDCHVEDLGDAKGVYTDLQLYSLERVTGGGRIGGGYGLGRGRDEELQFERPGTAPDPDEWKTPALWGVADSAPYFHDGACWTLEEAIHRHLGDAKHSLDEYRKLSPDDQRKVVEFLQTLKAPRTAP